jgi:hypothetical protein
MIVKPNYQLLKPALRLQAKPLCGIKMRTVLIIAIIFLSLKTYSQINLSMEFDSFENTTIDVSYYMHNRCTQKGHWSFKAKIDKQGYSEVIPIECDSIVIDFNGHIPLTIIGFNSLKEKNLKIVVPCSHAYVPIDTVISYREKKKFLSKSVNKSYNKSIPLNSLQLDSIPQTIDIQINNKVYTGYLKRNKYTKITEYDGKKVSGTVMEIGTDAIYWIKIN